MKQKIRVLVVDDSAFARFAISRQLRADPELEVIDFARDGAEALERIPVLKPDVVTLDVEMPHMDGLTALKKIMSAFPTPVVMLSTLTGSGTQATIKALELGAVDFFLKTSVTNPTGAGEVVDELRTKLKVAARVKVSPLRMPVRKPRVVAGSGGASGNGSKGRGLARRVVVIGSSTGGPRALYQVIPSLPPDLPASVMVVQHMPPGFTKSLAERLNQLSAIKVKEAEPGDIPQEGEAFIAPGGYHMILKPNGTVGLNRAPCVCGVRPSVDVTMESVVKIFGAATTGVVLTGMGSDGTNGTTLIKAAGGRVIAEDESTCSVYGMPRSVAEAGNADRIAPLPKVAAEITRMLKNERTLSR